MIRPLIRRSRQLLLSATVIVFVLFVIGIIGKSNGERNSFPDSGRMGSDNDHERIGIEWIDEDDVDEGIRNRKPMSIEDLVEMRKKIEAAMPKSDAELLETAVGHLRVAETPEEMRFAIEDMEQYLYQVDNAGLLPRFGGMKLLADALHHHDVEVRAAAATAIGVAAQGNEASQTEAVSEGVLYTLLSDLRDERVSLKLKKRMLFCLSTILRGLSDASKAARSAFAVDDGFGILSRIAGHEVLDADPTVELSIMKKTVGLINELVEIEQRHVDMGHVETTDDIPLLTSVLDYRDDWCSLIDHLLTKGVEYDKEDVVGGPRLHEYDAIEKAVNALLFFRKVCLVDSPGRRPAEIMGAKLDKLREEWKERVGAEATEYAAAKAAVGGESEDVDALERTTRYFTDLDALVVRLKTALPVPSSPPRRQPGEFADEL